MQTQIALSNLSGTVAPLPVGPAFGSRAIEPSADVFAGLVSSAGIEQTEELAAALLPFVEELATLPPAFWAAPPALAPAPLIVVTHGTIDVARGHQSLEEVVATTMTCEPALPEKSEALSESEIVSDGLPDRLGTPVTSALPQGMAKLGGERLALVDMPATADAKAPIFPSGRPESIRPESVRPERVPIAALPTPERSATAASPSVWVPLDTVTRLSPALPPVSGTTLVLVLAPELPLASAGLQTSPAGPIVLSGSFPAPIENVPLIAGDDSALAPEAAGRKAEGAVGPLLRALPRAESVWLWQGAFIADGGPIVSPLVAQPEGGSPDLSAALAFVSTPRDRATPENTSQELAPDLPQAPAPRNGLPKILQDGAIPAAMVGLPMLELGQTMQTMPALPLPSSVFPAGVLAAPTAPGSGMQTAVPYLAAQVVDSFVRKADGVTEFALSPDELGRVRVSLQADALNPDRINVMLSFDRTETMDLFRRHVDQLSDALRTAGYTGVDIGFDGSGPEQGGDHRPGEPDHDGDEAFMIQPIPVDESPHPLRISTTAFLDLRL